MCIHQPGHSQRAVVAQGSHGLPLDCGLCALKNVTGDVEILAEAAFATARALEATLCEQEATIGPQRSIVRHFMEGTGNLSGCAIKEIALANAYGFYRLSREQEGECGHARALMEMLSILTGPRLCGALWRQGPGVAGADASYGHWVGAAHIHGDGPWLTHEWI